MCYKDHLSICRIRINMEKNKKQGTIITTELLARIAEETVSLYYEGEDRAGMIAKLIIGLEANYNTWIDKPASLTDIKHLPWLPQKIGQINWQYWLRYRTWLFDNQWPDSTVNSIDDSTKTILGYLEDPDRIGDWDIRGLVVGHVQAGKTANYTGLICRAIDAGYKVIIILTGIHESLRCQTQLRIDEGILGYDSINNMFLELERTMTGVGLISSCDVMVDTITTRDANGDFRRTVAEHFGINPGGNPLIFVVKKNGSVLKNLINWVKWASKRHGTTAGRQLVRNVPLLLIDDEADLGSINIKAPPNDDQIESDEYDPSMINRRIRDILQHFEKSTYVGYTATPFANILIQPGKPSTKYGDDLFPRDFIVSLPASTDYMGPVQVFGIKSDPASDVEEIEGLPLIRRVDDYDSWMPSKHNLTHVPVYSPEEPLPPSLKTAIMSYIIAIAVRMSRGQIGVHNSMLIHVTRFQLVQQRVYNQVHAFLQNMQRRAQYGDGSRTVSWEDEFHELWENDYLPTSRNIISNYQTIWAEIHPYLYKAVMSLVQPKLINGLSTDILDYKQYADSGLNVIAIGGDKLSRGLTLEGLTVSYFLRTSRMYDTLMQMGRWFGYRNGFMDICRIFMSEDLLKWFKEITRANEELRQEFAHMAAIGAKPIDYGLKVRSHNDLLVTAPTKMRAGTKLDLSFSGSILETVVFRKDTDFIRGNAQAVWNFLESMAEKGKPIRNRSVKYQTVKTQNWTGLYWEDIPASMICDFLQEYRTHEDARKVNVTLIYRFIKKMVANPNKYLHKWSVYLAAGQHEVKKFQLPVSIGATLPMVTRAWNPDYAPGKGNEDNAYRIRRLVSPTDEGVDLISFDWDRAWDLTDSCWKEHPDPSRTKETPDHPSGWAFRQSRNVHQGLLLIYPLIPDENKSDLGPDGPPVFGIALSFPANQNDEKVRYVVSPVYADQEYGDME